MKILDGAVGSLRHLGLVNTMLTNDLIARLARSAILSQLQSLDLSRGTMTRRGADALFAHARAFAHLESIDLGDNHLTPAELARPPSRRSTPPASATVSAATGTKTIRQMMRRTRQTASWPSARKIQWWPVQFLHKRRK
jgi:hypothetical protein